MPSLQKSVDKDVLTSQIKANVLEIAEEKDLAEKTKKLEAFFALLVENKKEIGLGDEINLTDKRQKDAAEFFRHLLDFYFNKNLPILTQRETKSKKQIDGKTPKSIKNEPVSIIELEIGNKVKVEPNEVKSVSHCLASFSETEDMDAKWEYETGNKTEATTNLTPKLNSDVDEFCVTLKRFAVVGRAPNFLSIRIEDVISINEIDVEDINNPTARQKFTPTAIICHQGSNSPNSGHYVSYVKEVDDRPKDTKNTSIGDGKVKWFKYDDSSKTEVLGDSMNDVLQNAYSIKYSKIDEKGVNLPRFSQNPIGITNLGNTCWANSTMALFSSMVNEKEKVKDFYAENEMESLKEAKKEARKAQPKKKAKSNLYEEKDFTLSNLNNGIIPPPTIKVIFCAPAFETVEKKKNIWATKVSGEENFISNDRQNKYRVMHGVYKEDEGNFDQTIVNYTFKQILANCAKQLNLENDDIFKIINHAKAKGGVSNNLNVTTGKYEDGKLDDLDENFKKTAKKFSVMFQKQCESVGIYTGREGPNVRSVGLRLTFLPDEIVEELKCLKGKEVKDQKFVEQDKFDEIKACAISLKPTKSR